MSLSFNQIKRVGQWEVQIDTTARRGYFEHDVLGEGGGLWFELIPSSFRDGGCESILSDYDGVSELPKEVIQAIRELGHEVEIDEDFE